MPGHPQEIKLYGSARAAVLREAARAGAGMKLITRIVSRKQRPSVMKLEQNLREMAATVDGLYQLLGPRNWIFAAEPSLSAKRRRAR